MIIARAMMGLLPSRGSLLLPPKISPHWAMFASMEMAPAMVAAMVAMRMSRFLPPLPPSTQPNLGEKFLKLLLLFTVQEGFALIDRLNSIETQSSP